MLLVSLMMNTAESNTCQIVAYPWAQMMTNEFNMCSNGWFYEVILDSCREIVVDYYSGSPLHEYLQKQSLEHHSDVCSCGLQIVVDTSIFWSIKMVWSFLLSIKKFAKTLLAVTGARCVSTLLHEMKRRGKDCRFGVISMCIGTHMLSLSLCAPSPRKRVLEYVANHECLQLKCRHRNGGSGCFWTRGCCWRVLQCPDSWKQQSFI